MENKFHISKHGQRLHLKNQVGKLKRKVNLWKSLYKIEQLEKYMNQIFV